MNKEPAARVRFVWLHAEAGSLRGQYTRLYAWYVQLSFRIDKTGPYNKIPVYIKGHDQRSSVIEAEQVVSAQVELPPGYSIA